MARIKNWLVLAIFTTLTSVALSAQVGANPFVGGRPSQDQSQPSNEDMGETTLAQPSQSPMAKFGQWLTGMQFSMRELMVDAAYSLRDGQFLQLFYICLLAFLYGVFHAIGPGHGKTLVSSFFLARPGRIRQALGIGWSVSLVHAVVAIGIVVLFTYVLQQVLLVGVDHAGSLISSTASVAIIILGGLMLASALVTILSGGKKHLHLHYHPKVKKTPKHQNLKPLIIQEVNVNEHEIEHDHVHDETCNHSHEQKPVSLKELWLVSILSSVIPCPGAATLMAFAIAAQIPLAGIIAVCAMSLGVGITTGLAGVLAILAQRGVMKLTIQRLPRFIPLIGGFFRLAGSLLIIVSGIIMIGAPLA